MSIVVQSEFEYYGFDPRSIVGCSLWLDAADSNAFTFSSGSNIATWKDKSSNALTGNASNSPTRVSPDIDGLTFVNLNGTDQYFNFGNNLNMGTSSIYVFAVTQINSGSNANIISKSRSVVQSGRWFFLRDGSNLSFAVDPAGSADVRATLSSDTYANVRLLTGYWNRSNLFLLQNGTQVGSNTSSTTTNYSTTNLLYVGAYQDTAGTAPSGYYLNGKIGEIIVYIGSALTTAQLQQVEGYLSWKWKLTSFLPNNHPYKYYAPVSRPFQPVDIDPECILWLDAQDTTPGSMTIASGTSNITVWNDKSGFGSNFSGFANTTFPTIGTALCNVPVVNATAGGYFSNASYIWPATYSTFTAGYTTATNTWAGMFYAIPDAVFMIRSYLGSNYLFKGNQSAWGNNAGTYPLSTNHSVWAVTNPTTAGAATLYTNGSTTNTQTNSGVTNTAGTGGMIIGLWVNTSYPWKGYYGDVIFYNSGLSDSNRQLVEGYLGWKFNLISTFPSVHPFKNFSPLTTLFNPLHISGCQLWLDAADSNTVLAGISTLSSYVPATPTTSNLTNTGITLADLSNLLGGTTTMGGSFINGVPRAGYLAPSASNGVWYSCTQDIGYCKAVKLQFALSSGTLSVTALSAGFNGQSSSNTLLPTNPGSLNDSYYSGYTAQTFATSATSAGYGVASITMNYSGTNVYQWTDKSTAGRNYIQSSGTRALYASQTLTFDATYPGILSNSSTWSTSANYEIFAVGKPLTSGARHLLGSGPSENTVLYVNTTGAFGYLQGPPPSTFRQFGSLTLDGSSRVVIYANVTSSRAVSASLNGTFATSAATGTMSSYTTLFSTLGSITNTATWGDVNELIIYQNTLTRQQRQRVEGYLAQKWGIKSGLPSNHSYYRITP